VIDLTLAAPTDPDELQRLMELAYTLAQAENPEPTDGQVEAKFLALLLDGNNP
jgi:hypothetical protein